MTSYFVQKPFPIKFDPLFLVVPLLQHCHKTQHWNLHKPSRSPWRHKPLKWQQWRPVLSKNHCQAIYWPIYSPLCHRFITVTWLNIKFFINQWAAVLAKPSQWQQRRYILSKNVGKELLTPYSPLCHRFNTVTWLSIKLSTTEVICHVGITVAMATMTLYFPKAMAKELWPPIPVVPPFQHCHMTQHWILHKPSGLPWWHTPLLWQQWRHILSKNHGQGFSTPIPFCATISTLSHDPVSNSPQTNRVARVAQAVATATMTSYFVQKPRPSNFDLLFFFVPPFQHCHVTQHQILHKSIRLPRWHKPSLFQQWRYVFSKTMAKQFWSRIPLCATVSTLSHDSALTSREI